jgi:hypothetical protein
MSLAGKGGGNVIEMCGSCDTCRRERLMCPHFDPPGTICGIMADRRVECPYHIARNRLKLTPLDGEER